MRRSGVDCRLSITSGYPRYEKVPFLHSCWHTRHGILLCVAGNTFITNPEDMDGDSNATVLHDDRHVHLMICVVRDDGKVKGKVIVTKADLEEKAAVTIQSHFRGHMVRRASLCVHWL